MLVNKTMSSEFPIIQYLPLTRARATRRFLNKLNYKNIHAILDLEDSAQDPFDIEETRKLKHEARKGLISISESFKEDFHSMIYIRINAVTSEFFNKDIVAIKKSIKNGMPIKGIFLPKTENYETIVMIHKLFLENDIRLEIVPMIETQIGYKKLSDILINDQANSLISKVHYGHFDYSLDSSLWPFPDPNHKEYWEIIKPMVELLFEYKKVYIHTPFPFPNDKQLFWSSQFYLKSLFPRLNFWACTLNLELSLSEKPNTLNQLNCISLTNDQSQLVAEAESIIKGYYEGRANKRSFGMSTTRFIPPHQVFAAERFLDQFKK